MPLVLAPLMNLLLALLTPLVLALLISCVSEVLDISSTEFLFSTGSFSGDATKARRLVVSVVPSVASSSPSCPGCSPLTAVVLVSTHVPCAVTLPA